MGKKRARLKSWSRRITVEEQDQMTQNNQFITRLKVEESHFSVDLRRVLKVNEP